MVNITDATSDLFVVEPDNALKKDDRGLVARALVQGSKYVPLRLMNVTDEPQIIRKCTNIATLSPVCEVKRHCIRPAKQEHVPEHLKDSYPIPRIDDSLEQLSRAQWFSCLDLNAGYWQVEVDEADREKTAFTS